MKATNNSQALTWNPVICLALLYFISNLYFFFTVFSGDEIGIDSLNQRFDQDTSLIALLLLGLSFFFLLGLYWANTKLTSTRNFGLSNIWGGGIFAYQTLYLINSLYFGVNTAGVQDEIKSPFQFLFTLFDPDTLFLVIVISLRSPRLFWVNTGLYLISTVIRGWAGAFVIVPILLLCRYYPVRVKLSSIFFLVGSSIIILLTSPFIIEAKWLIRSGAELGQAISNVLERGYLESLYSTLEYIFRRFQMFGHVAILVENSDITAEAYNNNEFIPYWADGLLQWIVLKFNGTDIIQLNRYMVSHFFNVENSAYSTNPGLAGWLAILGERSIFFSAYIFLIIFFPAWLVRKYVGIPHFLLLYSFVFIWLFHGWIGAYFNFAIYSACIIFTKKLFTFRKSSLTITS
ncbi:oligosaccharide repeat unit polymerase [Pseudomonas sp. MPFS]|uniref:oligosaccharide repeat unit polymerase n=1 Tax=Pseudomonas sp. MPFS TaxID=2795724 RepID=UPI001F12F649|nr:oligosaccharide repeat unit polymerase [Pseudomonas sp. MPFS]UMZ10253.1 oligosaccharide repeat unit polymerase [Pseudomonas sp. MPFS]